MTDRLFLWYELMLAHFGPRGWWPANDDFEMAVGAILTQAVTWKNVEKAIGALLDRGWMDPVALCRADPGELEALIRPTRYYRQKRLKLVDFSRTLVERYGGDLQNMLRGPTLEVRERLLAIYGIGEETADCILLYAGDHPIFVVDAYTRRIFHRMGVFAADASYGAMQTFFHQLLPADTALYNEYHALIDGVGNRYCRAKDPLCGDCPLKSECPFGQEHLKSAPKGGGAP